MKSYSPVILFITAPLIMALSIDDLIGIYLMEDKIDRKSFNMYIDRRDTPETQEYCLHEQVYL